MLVRLGTATYNAPDRYLYPLRWGLSSHWTLDEASSTRADSHGPSTLTDNNTVTGRTGLATNTGTASQFTAANSEYLSTADTAALTPGNDDFWVAAWVRLDSTGADRYIVSKGTSLANNALEFSLRFQNSTGLIRAVMGDATNTAPPAVSATSYGILATGTNVFVLMWRSIASDLLGIRVNHGTATTVTVAGRTPSDTVGDFLIGARPGPGDYWDGGIDALSFGKAPALGIDAVIDEISERLYNAGSGRSYPWL